MKARYQVNNKASFRENLDIIVPQMFDAMMIYKHRVSGHPRMKKDLHMMRITGKPIRYLMEIMEHEYGSDFNKLLMEIKEALELMGEIHDCDVFTEELKKYLHELRSFNRSVQSKTVKFPTSGIIKLSKQLNQKRHAFYEKLVILLDSWEKNKFRDKLIKSMVTNRTNEINYFKKSATRN